MKQIPLTRGLFALVDDADFDWLNQWKWYALHSGGGRFYAARDKCANGQKCTILMHRAIAARIGIPEVDHKNRLSLDNQRDNLRPATSAQNKQNKGIRADNTSGFKGVSWSRQRARYTADITVNGKHIYLGSFLSPALAAVAYDAAAEKYFGEFAVLNFPNNKQHKPSKLKEDKIWQQ